MLKKSISQGIVDIRQSAIRSNENLHKDNVVALASQTTGILFSKANGLAVRISLGMLFRWVICSFGNYPRAVFLNKKCSYVDRNNLWWPPERIQSLTELVLNTLQVMFQKIDFFIRTHRDWLSARLAKVSLFVGLRDYTTARRWTSRGRWLYER